MKNNTTPKAVVCNETNEFFFSQALAAKKFNISPVTVASSCQEKTKKPYNGYTFRYATEEEIASVKKKIVVQEKSVVKGKGKRMNGNTKAVFDFSTGKFYTSATDAAELIGTAQGHVSHVCNSQGRTCKGHKICYVRDIPEHLDEIAEAISKGIMYDEFMTKEAKKKEFISHLKDLQSKADSITSEISRLTEELANIEDDIEKAKLELLNFCLN